MKKTRRIIAAIMAAIMCLSMSYAAFAMTEQNIDNTVPVYVTEAASRSTSTYWIGGDRYSFVRVFERTPSQGYHGPITIHVIDFNTSDYVCDIMVYGKDGILDGKDDWLGNTNLGIVNPSGAWAVTAVWVRIRPRPRLLFEAQPKNFQVNVTY